MDAGQAVAGSRGRAAGRGALVLAVFAAAGALAASPALFRADERFLGYGAPVEGRVTPGDHLQTAYNLWLPGHQLARGKAPWRDPYQFQPEARERVNFAGWPFAAVFGPLEAALGTVRGWNAFVLLTYVGAGGLAYTWLRALGLGFGAALAGGLVFALAPYRVAQSTGHLLGPVSMLLPLSLWAVERRRTVLAAAALASIPLSGQVHLALGAIPFVLLYAWSRRRFHVALSGAAAGAAAGLVVWGASLRDAPRRGFAEVERYSAELSDFVSRDIGAFEEIVFLGWLTPLVAVAGLALLRGRLAVALGLGAVVPCMLALGANLPGFERLWLHTPLQATRVPERLLPIASLALAGLAAFAVARLRRPLLVALAAAALVADVRMELYDPLVADERAAAHAAVSGPGRIVELPVLLPDDYGASVYLYYAIKEPRERPLGYSTTAPPVAFEVARALRRDPRDPVLLRSLGVEHVVSLPR